jgi:hypothetical protein
LENDSSYYRNGQTGGNYTRICIGLGCKPVNFLAKMNFLFVAVGDAITAANGRKLQGLA